MAEETLMEKLMRLLKAKANSIGVVDNCDVVVIKKDDKKEEVKDEKVQ